MNNQKSYSTVIKETHHKEKLDSPSGTAITTADIILSELINIVNGKMRNQS